ncbi:MAG TPA: carboxymuconolactone decarboxylase family protein, partial [Rhizomicrobium sp.]
MPTPIEYADASPQVRAVYDDIKTSRNVPDVNNFWKYLAHDPATLKRTWESIKDIMAPGALDPLTKEMVYLAVSVTNGCAYCIASHGAAARKAGMTDAMFGELMAVTGMEPTPNRPATLGLCGSTHGRRKWRKNLAATWQLRTCWQRIIPRQLRPHVERRTNSAAKSLACRRAVDVGTGP